MAKQDRKRINRAIALVASVVLAVGLVPVPAIAVGTGDELGGLASEASPAAATPDAVPLTQGDEGTASDEQPAKAERADDNGSETGAVASGNGKDDSGADSADSDGAAAADSDGDKGQPSDEAEQTDDDKVSAKSASSDKDKDKNEGKDAKSESPAFSQSATVDNVTIAVEADAGVFPEGARLSVAGAPPSATEGAIASERGADVNVAASYTFDIKVLDADGTELQPADGNSVRVSFKAAEVADPNLDVSVYHVPEGASGAEELGVDVSDATVTAESSGFSFYTVEFTYGDLHYVLKGGEKVALADILSAVGLSGEVTAVEVSNSELFSASKVEGAWVVFSHEAFTTDEWMRVTIADKAYEIKVTDDQSGTCGENLTWTLSGSTLTISGTGAMYDYEGPWNGEWTDDASPWAGNTGITSVVIGDGVTSIGDFAFYDCKKIESVTIPSSVTAIGVAAFYYCESLQSVTIPGSVTNVGDDAFADCNFLKSVTFHYGVKTIGSRAFRSCGLESVTIPPTVESVGLDAFVGRSRMTVRFGGSEEQWERISKPDNDGRKFEDGIQPTYVCGEDLPWTLSGEGDNLTLTITGTGAMYDYFGGFYTPWYDRASKITSIVFNGEVTTIGSWAFNACNKLKSVAIPNSVKVIGAGAFAVCSSLAGVEIPNGVEAIEPDAFSACKIESIEIPISVKTIGESAFAGCNELEAVAIPSSVTSVGRDAFL
ncbi:MAG: leucine-rich repeat domain-containing protein [Kiritimatiellae bacterium]|nr:leucine-rich repeat domain-containing protein [Kiritimatiellia bacterium]